MTAAPAPEPNVFMLIREMKEAGLGIEDIQVKLRRDHGVEIQLEHIKRFVIVRAK